MKTKEQQIESLKNLIAGYEKINAEIFELEKTLPYAGVANRDLTFEEFIRQQLYGLRCDLGKIHQYTTQELRELKDED